MGEVIVNLFDDYKVACKGTYSKAEEDVNLKASFEIDEIYNINKDVYPIFEYCWLKGNSALQELEQLCIEEYEKQL